MLRPESAQESRASVVQSSFISSFPAHHIRAVSATGAQHRVVKQIPEQAAAVRKLEFGAPATSTQSQKRHPNEDQSVPVNVNALHPHSKDELRSQDAADSRLRAERSRSRQGVPLGGDISQQIRLWTSFLPAQAQAKSQAFSASCEEDAGADHANVDVYAPGFQVPFQNTVRGPVLALANVVTHGRYIIPCLDSECLTTPCASSGQICQAQNCELPAGDTRIHKKIQGTEEVSFGRLHT
jgi:hypothetical protein